jgi:hypothetical protein
MEGSRLASATSQLRVSSDGSAVAGVDVFDSGRNIVGDRYIPIVSELKPSSGPNTEMRVELQQRPKGIRADLGWERLGSEVNLSTDEAGW